jgi:hypothetical protein
VYVGFLLTQDKYATDILGMISCKPVATPMSTSEKLSVHEGECLGLEDITKYHIIVVHVSHRPGLAFSINKVYQYLHSPTIAHWTVVKHILWYIKFTLGTQV